MSRKPSLQVNDFTNFHGMYEVRKARSRKLYPTNQTNPHKMPGDKVSWQNGYQNHQMWVGFWTRKVLAMSMASQHGQPQPPSKNPMHSSFKMNRKKKAYPTKLCQRSKTASTQRDTSRYLLQHPWHARLYRYFHLGIAAFSECWFYGWPIGLVSWPANGLRIWNNEKMMESNPCPGSF